MKDIYVEKENNKNLLIVIVTILIITVLPIVILTIFAVYIAIPSTIDINIMTEEDKNIILSNLGLEYIPKSLKLDKIKYHKFERDSTYVIYYYIDEEEYEEFYKLNSWSYDENRVHTELKTKRDKVYYKVKLSEYTERFQEITKIVNKY